MATGSIGERRLADVIGIVVMMARTATGETKEHMHEPSGRVRKGLAGVSAHARKISKEERGAVARKAAVA